MARRWVPSPVAALGQHLDEAVLLDRQDSGLHRGVAQERRRLGRIDHLGEIRSDPVGSRRQQVDVARVPLRPDLLLGDGRRGGRGRGCAGRDLAGGSGRRTSAPEVDDARADDRRHDQGGGHDGSGRTPTTRTPAPRGLQGHLLEPGTPDAVGGTGQQFVELTHGVLRSGRAVPVRSRARAAASGS